MENMMHMIYASGKSLYLLRPSMIVLTKMISPVPNVSTAVTF